MSVSPDFYGANNLTCYPFVRELLPITAAFIDAVVSVENPYADADVKAVYIVRSDGSSPQIEIESEGDILIDRTDPVSVETFGAYEIWRVSGDKAYGVFVVDVSVDVGVYDDPTGLILVQHAIMGLGGDQVEAVGSGASEAAGPGEAVDLVMGDHMEASVTDNILTLSAKYRSEDECNPRAGKKKPGLLTFNGIGPDEFGNFQISGQFGGTFIVDNDFQNRKITIFNTGNACCDCEDYERLFSYVVISHERLLQLRAWSISNQARYADMQGYLKFLLRMPIVDADLEDDYIAECNP